MLIYVKNENKDDIEENENKDDIEENENKDDIEENENKDDIEENENKDDIVQNIDKYLYKYQIFISGDNCHNSKMKSYLKDNDLMCYNSRIEDIDKEKLVLMMGSSLMIVMYQNNEIQNREINTARKLNIPILFIYNSEEDKIDHKVKKENTTNEGEYKVVLKNLEEIEMILKYRFKLIKNIKKRKNLPFKTLEKKTELFECDKLNSVSILKEKKKLLLAGDTIQSLDLDKNTFEDIQSHRFNEGQLNVCVNNKDKEIIILNNKVFSKYFYVFSKFVKLSISENKISGVEDDVVINEIVVNEEKKHVYGISNLSHKLYHFDKKFKLIQTMYLTIPLLIKVFNNNLYMLLKSYENSNIEGKDTSQIIENIKSYIGVYSQKENEFVKFERKIVLDVLVTPRDFHVDENYIFIFTPFINKNHLFNHKLHVLAFNHDGILLQKTGLDMEFQADSRFLIVDNQTIYCADYKTKIFKRLEFTDS
jgi:hypothetical protein